MQNAKPNSVREAFESFMDNSTVIGVNRWKFANECHNLSLYSFDFWYKTFIKKYSSITISAATNVLDIYRNCGYNRYCNPRGHHGPKVLLISEWHLHLEIARFSMILFLKWFLRVTLQDFIQNWRQHQIWLSGSDNLQFKRRAARGILCKWWYEHVQHR